MNDEPKMIVGRLALREIDGFWKAYYATEQTMDGALLLGSIRMGLILRDPRVKEAFMAMMRVAVGNMLKEVIGSKVVGWNDPIPAPDDERGQGEPGPRK